MNVTCAAIVRDRCVHTHCFLHDIIESGEYVELVNDVLSAIFVKDSTGLH